VSPTDYQVAFGAGQRSSRPTAAAVPISTIVRGSDAGEWFGLTGPANLPALTERTALTISAVYACVNLVAGALSALPMHIYRSMPDGERTRLYSDPLWWLLNEEFCARWAASTAWEFLAMSKLLHGDAFAEIIRRGSTVVGLVPIHPMRVQVAPWPDGSRLAYQVWPDAWATDRAPRVLDQDDMLHVAGLGFDGCRSMSPLRYALRMSGAVALATQDFSAQFFANQARPDYALTTDGKMDQQQVDDLRAQIDERHSRAAGMAGRPMLLQGGLDIKTISLPNEDAELIATRQFQIEEIARVYGIPPFMIGHNEKTTSWGSGVGEMGKAFVRYALRQHLNAFQNEINRKFFRTAGRVAEFDTFELESGDMKSLFEAFRIAVGRAGEPGFMSVDEVRARINLNRAAGGDQLNQGAVNATQSAA
jgi:HK97 family phage portal protein